MSKLRRKFITVLAVFICALLALSTAFLIPDKTANAARGLNFTAIDEIYSGNGGFNATNMQKLYAALTGDKDATYETVKSKLSGAATDKNGTSYLSSQDIRNNQKNLGVKDSNGNGFNVSVTFGGIKWDIVYVTTATSDIDKDNDGEGDIIVDLWRSADTVTEKSEFAYKHAKNSTSDDYTSNMYSTSYVRVVTLNAGGKYTSEGINSANLVDYTPKDNESDNIYARFTSKNANDSLTDYIVQPTYVAYQANEDTRDKYKPGNVSNPTFQCLNDAYNTLSNSDTTWSNDNVRMIQDKGTGVTAYGAWKEDYLWLPSFAETGNSDDTLNNKKRNGIWETDIALRSAVGNLATNYTWLRSGHNESASKAFYLTDGGSHGVVETSEPRAVRPAIHFNLTAAKTLYTEDIKTTYTGSNIELDGIYTAKSTEAPWYIPTVYSTKIMDYVYKLGNDVSPVLNVGTYTATMSFKSSVTYGYKWDKNNTSSTITITVNKKKVKVSFTTDAGKSISDGHIVTSGDIQNYPAVDWFDINQIASNDRGTDKCPDLKINYYSKTDKNYSYTKPTKPGDYIAYAEIEYNSGAQYQNYELDTTSKISIEFTVTAAGSTFTDSDLKWQYKNADIDKNKAQDIADNGHVAYNGKPYTISLKTTSAELEALGVMIDLSYGTNGFAGDITMEDSNGVNGSAAVYTVTVKIVAHADYVFPDREVTFSWYIDKTTFELSSLNSSVKWGYTARGSEVKEYDKASGIPYEGGGQDGTIVMMIKEGLPTWLTPKYDTISCKGSAVNNGSNYTARITGFTSTNTNYIVSDANADWLTCDWMIVPRTLSTSDWTAVQYSDGKVTAAPKLLTPPYSPYFDYKYYEDSSRTTELTFGQLTYTDGVTKVYYVWAYILPADAGNWILDSAGNPHGFEVGKDKDAVDITITAGGEYDGTAKEAIVEIVKDVEGITLNSFDITYYKVGNDNPLGGAPTDAGSYRAVVTLKPVFAEKYYISSGNELNFEIKARILDVPTFSGTLIYDGTERDVATLCGLPDDWENYIDVTIAGTGGNTDTVVKNKGRYSVTFEIKNGINDNARNVEWNTDSGSAKLVPQTVYITVEQLELTAKKWNENKYYSRIEFDNDDAEKFVVYKVYDANGDEVSYGTVLGRVGEMFVVEVSVGTEHGDNVIISYFAGVTARHVFWTDGGEDPIEVTVPTIADLIFNGDKQTFVIDYGKFADYIELLGDDKVLTQFNAGEYSIYVTIKTGKNAVWAGTDKNRDPVELKFEMKPLVLENPKVPENQKFTYTGREITAILNIDGAVRAQFVILDGVYKATNAGEYTFKLSIDPSFAGNVVWASAGEKSVKWEIEKAKISVKWTNGDVPELDLPEEFKDLDIEYVFTDETGKEVSKDDLEPGKKYTVTATLSDGSYANYEFVDDSGKTLKNPAKTDGFDFEIKNKSSSFPWWIIAVVAGLLLAAAAVIVVVIKKRQAADGDDYDDYYDDEYDFDEEYEEDDFGDDDF